MCCAEHRNASPVAEGKNDPSSEARKRRRSLSYVETL